jgi:hypothetical protein
MDINIEFYDDEGFGWVHCPWCGHPENLSCDIEDDWTCENCGKDFFITAARVVTPLRPRFEVDGRERRETIHVNLIPNEESERVFRDKETENSDND